MNRTEVDNLEQYGRRNCLVFHGLEETKGEDTTQLVIDTVKTKLGLSLDKKDFDRSHRLGAPAVGRNRPLIAKFTRYVERASVYRMKKKLKGTGILITESLTRHRMNIFNQAMETFGSKKVWTQDGNIFREGERGKIFVSV